jgi:endonuclease/exonuclease/phosphatase (EEP) superfamily protein YafD
MRSLVSLNPRIAVRDLALVAGLSFSALGLLSLAPMVWRDEPPWWVDLLAPFAFHGLIALVAATALWSWVGWRRVSGVTAVLMVIAVVRLYPACLARPVEPPPSAPRLTVLHLNVNTANGQLDVLKQLILDSGADVVSVVELSFAAEKALATLPPPWHPLLTRPSRDNFGIGMYARIPAVSARPRQLDVVFPAIEAVLPLGDREVVVTAVHVMPPIDAEASEANRRQLVEVAGWMKAEPRPRILVGDFNATPWSWSLRALADTGVTRAGGGYRSTWPAPLGPLGIPIDHAFVSAELTTTELDVLAIHDSDHHGFRMVVAGLPRAGLAALR